MTSDIPPKRWSWPMFAAWTGVCLWVAHAAAFFSHEYAHTTVAWLLGWKASPLALHYPKPTWIVWLVQLGIDQDVDEAPIFASGHGAHAALIGAAGMVVGNLLLTYPLSRWGLAAALRAGKRVWALLCFWLLVASVGNLIDYVPARTFATSGDMVSLERGFGWSPWLVLIILGVPSVALLLELLLRTGPVALRRLLPQERGMRGLTAGLAAMLLFGFYGAAGWGNADVATHRMAVLSVCVLMPLVAVASAWAASRKA